MQHDQGQAVVLVVTLDVAAIRRGDSLWHTLFEGAGHAPQSGRRLLAQLDLAFVAEERLKRFQRVALDAGPQPLARDRVQIDEALAAEQRVQLVLARRVPHRQTPQGCGFVGGVVVNVQVRVGGLAFEDEVDEEFEGALLLTWAEGPQPGVLPCPRLVVERVARQVLEPAALYVGVAFEIQVDVAWRGFGQAREAAALLVFEQLGDRLVAQPALELDRRLALQLGKGRHATTLRLLVQGLGRRGKGLERRATLPLDLARVRR